MLLGIGVLNKDTLYAADKNKIWKIDLNPAHLATLIFTYGTLELIYDVAVI